eukprot:644980-Pleurochrysis_carterae.AAC.2
MAIEEASALVLSITHSGCALRTVWNKEHQGTLRLADVRRTARLHVLLELAPLYPLRKARLKVASYRLQLSDGTAPQTARRRESADRVTDGSKHSCGSAKERYCSTARFLADERDAPCSRAKRQSLGRQPRHESNRRRCVPAARPGRTPAHLLRVRGYSWTSPHSPPSLRSVALSTHGHKTRKRSSRSRSLNAALERARVRGLKSSPALARWWPKSRGSLRSRSMDGCIEAAWAASASARALTPRGWEQTPTVSFLQLPLTAFDAMLPPAAQDSQLYQRQLWGLG